MASITWSPTSGNNWSTNANWVGGVKPAVGDTAVFDGAVSSANCTLDANQSITGVTSTGAYAGTLTQAASITLTLSGAFTWGSGAFSGSAAAITITGAFAVNGGTFLSTSGTLECRNNFTLAAAVFTHNSGTVKLAHTVNTAVALDFGGNTVNNLTLSNADTADTVTTIAGDFSVAGDLLVTSTTGTANYGRTYTAVATSLITITLAGNFTLSKGTAKVRWGSFATGDTSYVAVTMTGANKAVGSACTRNNGHLNLTGSGTTNLAYRDGNAPYTGTLTITQSSGKALLTANSIFYNLVISASNELDVSASNYSVTVYSNLTVTGTFTPQAGTVTVNHTGVDATITGGTFYDLVLHATATLAKTTTLAGTITVANNLTITSAAGLSSARHTWSLTGTMTVTGNLTITETTSRITLSFPGTLTVNGTITVNSGILDASASNGTLNCGGNWSIAGTWTQRSGTVNLTGTNQTISGSYTWFNFNKTVAAAATLTLPAGATQTVGGTLTLLGASGQLLSLRSSTPGTTAAIRANGPRVIGYLDVKDCQGTHPTAIDCVGKNCTDSGNNHT